MKRISLLLVFIIGIILLYPSSVFASNGYTIENYNIEMVVNEDNTFDITEEITTNFEILKHGIYRKLPVYNTVVRLDGSSSKNRAIVSNISVNEKYTLEKNLEYQIIKIGDANKTITGRNKYIIKYRYNIGNDPLENADELYFNLIGNEWDTEIKKVKFKIEMPKDFDPASLGFSSGDYGLTDSSNVIYSVNGKVITGETIGELYGGQALTVRLTLPEDYFVKQKFRFDTFSILVVIFSLMCAVFSFILWKLYGKDDEVIETVEFYPPEGLNSAELGFLFSGSSKTDHIVSLIVYLAEKGYLKIGEGDGPYEFTIEKLKEYDGNNEIEKMFMEELFKYAPKEKVDYDKARKIRKEAKENGEKVGFFKSISMATTKVPQNKVKNSDLYDRFYQSLNMIKKFINKKYTENVYEKSAEKKANWLRLMMVTVMLLTIGKTLLDLYGVAGGIASIVITLFAFLISILEPISALSLILFVVFSSLESLPIVLQFVWVPIDNLPMLIFGTICTVILGFLIAIMPKRTKYGTDMLGKIKGFKKFLTTAEKEQLEALVDKDPEYFYNILPYTYSLGVSKKWMDKFKVIATEPPRWYSSSSVYDFEHFSESFNSIMRYTSSSMTSSPSSSSSGGGSSGGGSGGGGGGSW